MRLCANALADWAYVDGYAVSAGIDLLDLPLARFTNFIWWLMTRNADKPEVDKIRAKLWMPPKGVAPAPQSPWSPEAETAAMKGLKAMLGGGKPTT